MGDAPALGPWLRVFLCHASGDKPAVRALYQRLLPGEVVDSGERAILRDKILGKNRPGRNYCWCATIHAALNGAELYT
jgi:hypothetical protein